MKIKSPWNWIYCACADLDNGVSFIVSFNPRSHLACQALSTSPPSFNLIFPPEICSIGRLVWLGGKFGVEKATEIRLRNQWSLAEENKLSHQTDEEQDGRQLQSVPIAPVLLEFLLDDIFEAWVRDWMGFCKSVWASLVSITVIELKAIFLFSWFKTFINSQSSKIKNM